MDIRNARMEDLSRIIEIEDTCFSPAEAASKEALKQRIEYISDSFFVAEEDGEIIGIINGPVIEDEYITDDLFKVVGKNPSLGGHQSILGLAVSPNYQNRGVATSLLKHLQQEAKVKQRKSISLTCKKELVNFYEQRGFVNKGISSSEHGSVTWYNIIKKIF